MKNTIDWKRWATNKKGDNPMPEVFNWFIERFEYKRYLELGIRDGGTFRAVDCEHKESVDNNSKWNATYKMITDNFFKREAKDQTWDIIFVDANHNKEFVLRDIENSLKHLTPNGTIFAHDVNPLTENLLVSRYCHDAWEAFAELRQTRDDLSMYTFPFGFLGLIRVGKQRLWKKKIKPTWEYFEKNRERLVRQMTEEDFYDLFGENK